jgi:hypothetical protein
MIVPRRLVALNLVAGALACLFAAGLVRELATARPLPAPGGRERSGSPPTASPAERASAASPPRAYPTIAAKNLFSPTRSEAPAGPVLAVGPKPFLWGVVMNGPKSRAYLEDPGAKRVFGYGVGDTVGGGRLESITPDRVVIARPDGRLEVLLQDPAKPHAATPAAAIGPAGVLPRPLTRPSPGAPPRPPAATPRLAPPRPIAPGALQR